MTNGDVLLDIQNQEQVPALTPANQNPTPMSRDDEIPIQDDVTHLLSMGSRLILADDDSRTSIDRLLTIKRLKDEIGKSSQQRNSIEEITKIQRIPKIMSQQKKFGKEYYRPRAMTIGPIFESRKPEECSALKLKLAAEFIKNSGRNDDVLLASIQEEIADLSSCFDNQVLERFERHRSLDVTLLLDGCSTLQFIYSRVWDELKELQINNGEASLIEQDLFLMENQIPFRLLEILMDQLPSGGLFSRTDLQGSIDIFIQMNLMTPENFLNRSYLDFYKEIGKKPVHLLDILRSGLLYAFDASIYFRNILDLSIGDRRSGDPSFNNEPKREYFRNIQELKAARIKLESSGISCLGDVTFTSCGWFRARLKLPPLIVNDSTGRKLWNLVAYEMCPENCKSDYGVTSYVRLLDSLIDNEEDVKELRSARILRNHLSSDNEVAKLFNEIGFNTAFDQVYPEVKRKIQKRFNSRWAMLIAQFLQEYFRRPWTFIALLGAIAALALTATQTHFTIHPTK